MTPLRFLSVMTCLLVSLVLSLTVQALAAPFPGLTFQSDVLSESGSQNPCDTVNCEGFTTGGVIDPLPQFGLVGKTVLTAEISYNVSSRAGAHVTNGSASTVQSSSFMVAETSFFFGNSQLFVVTDQEFGAGGATLLPGESATFPGPLAQMVDTVVLLPGDPLFPQFLGHGDVDFAATVFASSHGDTSDLLLAPVIHTWEFLATYEITYRYCTPEVDRGCPDAIPGFNSPVPVPATLLLLACGVVWVAYANRAGRTS